MRQTITFDEVKQYGQKSVKCAGGCGRTLKRSRKFWQTVSPFNVASDGQPKDRHQIYAEIQAERLAWSKEPETCKHCRKG